MKDSQDWLDERKCKYCGETKPLTMFQKAKNCTSGYRYRCKACTSKVVRVVYESNPDKKQATNKVYKEKHYTRLMRLANERRDPVKAKANQAVNNAIAAGKFTREPCQVCGEKKVDFHHTDGYEKDKWFVGMWLCRPHHAQKHKELRWATN